MDRFPKPATILDVGCGGGDHARSLAKEGYSVYACDKDIGQDKGLPAPGKEGSGVTFFRTTAESLTKAPEIKGIKFDGIWMLQYALPWVDDAPSTLNNLNDLLNVGGSLYVSIFEPFIPGKHSEIYGQSVELRSQGSQVKTGTVESLARLLEQEELPLKINSCEFAGRSTPPLNSGRRRNMDNPDGEAIENPASLLMLTKEPRFRPAMNIDHEGKLRNITIKAPRESS